MKDIMKYYEYNREMVTVLFSFISGSALIFFNVTTVGPKSEFLFTIFNIAAVGIVTLPIALVYYKRYKMIQAYEEIYPDFLKIIVEGLNGGMSLPLAINYAAQSNYGVLTPHIKRLVAQMSWGINFEAALKNFAESSRSPLITRSVSTIIECHRSGGKIADVMSSVSGSLIEIEKIRRERSMMISSQMMTGYIIFFVFLIVMIGIREFLICGFSYQGSSFEDSTLMQGTSVDSDAYGSMFTHLAIIQGFFSGLVIGKLSEGSISAGVKHSIILALIGYTALTVAHAIVLTVGISCTTMF